MNDVIKAKERLEAAIIALDNAYDEKQAAQKEYRLALIAATSASNWIGKKVKRTEKGFFGSKSITRRGRVERNDRDVTFFIGGKSYLPGECYVVSSTRKTSWPFIATSKSHEPWQLDE